MVGLHEVADRRRQRRHHTHAEPHSLPAGSLRRNRVVHLLRLQLGLAHGLTPWAAASAGFAPCVSYGASITTPLGGASAIDCPAGTSSRVAFWLNCSARM